MTVEQLQQINEGNHKCIKVIDSCETLDQLRNARNFVALFSKNIMWPRVDEIDLFDKKIKGTINMVVNIDNKLLELIKLKKIQLKNTSK